MPPENIKAKVFLIFSGGIENQRLAVMGLATCSGFTINNVKSLALFRSGLMFIPMKNQ